MAAMLRASGSEFDHDAFCPGSTLSICRRYRRGELRFPASQPGGRLNSTFGINAVVSEADFSEFSKQVEDAIVFLTAHRGEIERLVNSPGVEGVTLDFGIERRDVVVQCDRFSPELIRLAGQLGLGIELSQYPVSDDDEPEDPTDLEDDREE
jgi:hypothetical protein